MQRYGIAGVLIAILIIGIASNHAPQTEQQVDKKGYVVLFDEKPKLYNDLIYYANQQIGQILSSTEGNAGVLKMVVDIEKDFVDDTGFNIAFYPDHGRLNVVRLQTEGPPVSGDELFCGFSSKAALNWFKFKTLLKNRIAAAQRRAQELHRKSGLS